jgi:hypothetical protein
MWCLYQSKVPWIKDGQKWVIPLEFRDSAIVNKLYLLILLYTEHCALSEVYLRHTLLRELILLPAER